MHKILFAIIVVLAIVSLKTAGFSQEPKVRFPKGPFPIKTEVSSVKNLLPASIHVYPDYAEVFSDKHALIFRVGILPDKGVYKIYTVLNTDTPKLIAYSSGMSIYDPDGNFIGSYFRTPIYTYTYAKNGTKLGDVKCIAFSAVCGLASSVYLILLSS